MSYREIPENRLSNLVPTLTAGRTVIMISALGSEAARVCYVAWNLARQVARAGTRTLLVDLDLESPALKKEASDSTDEGIVDAFLFGVSLNHVARQQEPDLYYIGTGSAPVDPETVWASQRWQKLARGFKSQGAVMVLSVPLAAWGKMALEPDLLVLLAPRGWHPEAMRVPGLKRLLDSEVPVVVVVRQADRAPLRDKGPRNGDRAKLRGAALGALLAVVAAGLWLRGRLAPQEPVPDSGAVAPEAPTPPEEAGAADSLFYSVQVAAFNTIAQAAEYARELRGVSQVATVVPVRLGTQGTWYRVLVGALPTAAAADSLLRHLWEGGWVERPKGTILRTPFALEVPSGNLEQLMESGLPWYAVRTPAGAERFLTGAFEESSQARLTDSLLAAAGLKTKLVRRLGTRP